MSEELQEGLQEGLKPKSKIMKIEHIERHLTCHCYDRERVPLIEILHLQAHRGRTERLLHNEILYLIEGDLQITFRDNPGGVLHKGEMAFMASSDHATYKAHEDSVFLTFRITNAMSHLCHVFNIEKLWNEGEEGVAGMAKPRTMQVLTSNSRIDHLVQGVMYALEDGLKCRHFLQMEISKLLTMIRCYYTDAVLSNFFHTILSPDTHFSEHVRRHHLEYPSVNKLADSMNMTPQKFTGRFIDVFGMAPYKWMQQEKARLIHDEIRRGEKPLKEIAMDYGFNIQSNFNRFCRKFFNLPPTEIRKETNP